MVCQTLLFVLAVVSSIVIHVLTRVSEVMVHSVLNDNTSSESKEQMFGEMSC